MEVVRLEKPEHVKVKNAELELWLGDIYGDCVGLRLFGRHSTGDSDEECCGRIVSFQVLCSNHPHWVPCDGPFDTLWIRDLEIVLEKAKIWLHRNCTGDQEHGWSLRKSREHSITKGHHGSRKR